jgi:hypothetical protein
MTRRRPVWFRNGVVQRNHASPVTWQGYAVALAALAGVAGSLALGITLVPAHPVVGSLVLLGGIGGSLVAYFVALSLYGEP